MLEMVIYIHTYSQEASVLSSIHITTEYINRILTALYIDVLLDTRAFLALVVTVTLTHTSRI